jgi:alpha-1,2-mannosyltransferase
MPSDPVPASRPRLAVAWVLSLLAAPVVVAGLARVLSSWTGELHHAALVTLAALLPTFVAGAVALVRGATHPLPAWLAAAGAAAMLLLLTPSPVTAIVAAALAGAVAARGLPWATASAPVPRGRGAAVLWGLLAALAVVQVGRMSVFMADATERWGALAPSVDFVARHSCLTSYVHGAELARRGDANIYDDRYGFEGDEPPELPSAMDIGPLTMDTYEYPPQFLPLPRLMLAISRDFAAIRALWFTLTVAVFALVTFVLARWLGGEAERRMRLLVLAVGLSLPVLTAVYFGNFQITAMGLSALAMYAIFTGRTRRGAALLAFMIGAKIFPGILGVYLLAARRFAAAAWTAAFGAVYALLALALFGTRPFVDFFDYHLPRLASGETFSFLSEPVAAMSNVGVFGVPFRLRIAGWGGSEADAWALAQHLSWGFTLLVVAVAVLAGWRRRAPETTRERLAMITGWFGLLALGALRSPFAPLEAMIPVIWALAFRAAAAERRREAVVAGALWVVLMINVPVPTPASAVIALVMQAIAWGTAVWLGLGGRPGRAGRDAGAWVHSSKHVLT